ncbi:hypothetical protein V8C26DRAFT_241881 [Trichoderma gracile]
MVITTLRSASIRRRWVQRPASEAPLAPPSSTAGRQTTPTPCRSPGCDAGFDGERESKTSISLTSKYIQGGPPGTCVDAAMCLALKGWLWRPLEAKADHALCDFTCVLEGLDVARDWCMASAAGSTREGGRKKENHHQPLAVANGAPPPPDCCRKEAKTVKSSIVTRPAETQALVGWEVAVRHTVSTVYFASSWGFWCPLLLHHTRYAGQTKENMDC